ncbi:hypothetical protein [Mucilaginibacter flavus]|uniref:hypothetical protein n=1 Tax=Mucilaginibacter flavus TaxID=931504 RepID=UPI0025B5B015|nr:hypothetical protein [Mucilaginibacter flavus]MDN3584873.1 hypothetical protein [Mucilaginibacter flavus]
MPQLISKLQHNTYEKGEFSDEAPRNLEETIQLIKDFPWDLERPLTDIQLTGPSVTIIDDGLNYLKLGLYFGGKFCVYYLDRRNHLYEYHAPDIATANNLVSDFFTQSLDIKIFEKHFFNIGNQGHFITNPFVYRLKTWNIMAVSFALYAYVIFLSVLFFKITVDDWRQVFPIVFLIISGLAILYFVINNLKGRHQYLQISKGSDKFSYGIDDQHILIYEKAEIYQILYHQNSRSRGGLFDKYKIVFKNGEVISLSGTLLSGDIFLGKLNKKLGIPVIDVRN